MIKHKAFTILELLLYLALASVITLTASTLLANVIQIREKNRATYEVESQGELLIQRITREVRNATRVTAPAPQTSSTTGIQIATSDAATNPTVIEIAGAGLGIKEAGALSAIALLSTKTGIKDFSVQNMAIDADHPDEIKITFTLFFITEEQRAGYNYEKTFYGSASTRSVP